MKTQTGSKSVQSDSGRRIRVAIVEDDPFMRQTLIDLIEAEEDLKCVGAFPDGGTALAGLQNSTPDVVVMDVKLPGCSGPECVRQLKPLMPDAQFIMHTVYDDDDEVFSALAAGAVGYLLKRSTHNRILEAIRDARNGGSPMSSHIARLVVQRFHQKGAPDSAGANWKLSPREEQILEALTQGYRYKEIGQKLGIGVETVRTHLRHIYEKLHVSSRVEAVVLFLERK